MTIPLVTTALTAPNTAEPETFNDDADQWAADIIPWTAEVNALATAANDTAAQVDSDKLASEAAAIASAAFSEDAEASAMAAAGILSLAQAASDFKGSWSALTGALNKPATVAHLGSYWALLNNLADVTASTPGVSNTDWLFVSGTRWQAASTASFTAAANAYWPILATGSAVDATLPAMSAGSFICIYNQTGSTQTVRIINAGYTIRSRNNAITSADNIILQAGQMAYLLCINSTNLEVIANG